jgi:hypothetical protein
VRHRGLRVRWLGHRLLRELSLTVDETLSARQSHDYAEDVRHALFHASPQVTTVIVHVESGGDEGDGPHGLTATMSPDLALDHGWRTDYFRVMRPLRPFHHQDAHVRRARR